MKRNTLPITVLSLFAGLAGSALPGIGDAHASPPPVTVSGRAFPGGWPDRALHSCTFRIGIDGFAAGREAHVVFRAVPPTAPVSGDSVVLRDSFVVEGPSETATYDLRDPLMQRFRAGTSAGWEVELEIEITGGAGGAGGAFGASAVFIVANDCIVPPAPTSTTTTTTVNPCPADGCGQEPPAAILSGSRGEVAGEQGSYCWSPGPEGPGRCADFLFRDPATALTVVRGEPLTLRFLTAEAPTEVKVFRHERVGRQFEPLFAAEERTLAASNPTTLRADFPVGTSWLVVSTRWQQGSSVSFFEVDVRPQAHARPATATPARLALTG